MDDDSPSPSDREQEVLAAFVKKIREEQETHNLPRLSLQDYTRAFQAADRPTDEQIENFIVYVAEAHSWYKHLPLLPPGRPFFFFLDPCAGYDVDGAGMTTRRKERTDESRLHYNYRKTSVYRNSFGALEFADRGSDEPAVHIEGTGRFRLPVEVLSIGVAELTAVVHDWSQNRARYYAWVRSSHRFLYWLHTTPAIERDWPEEIGGNAFRDQLAKRIRLSLDEISRIWDAEGGKEGEAPVFQLEDFENGDPFGAKEMLKIMQAREFDLMRCALRRVRALVFAE